MESTRAIIVGEPTIQATLHTPSGNQHGNAEYFDTYAEAVAWANATRKAELERLGPVAKSIGLDGPWELRTK